MNINFNYFNTLNDTTSTFISIDEIYNVITSDKYHGVTSDIRHFQTLIEKYTLENNKKEVSRFDKQKKLLKSKLPLVAYSNKSTIDRKAETAIVNNFICLDFDIKDNTINLKENRETIVSLFDNCILSFITPSGGLKLVLSINCDNRNDFIAYYLYYKQYCNDIKLGDNKDNLVMDSLCKQPNFFHYLSYDKDCYLNKECTQFSLNSNEIKELLKNEKKNDREVNDIANETINKINIDISADIDFDNDINYKSIQVAYDKIYEITNSRYATLSKIAGFCNAKGIQYDKLYRVLYNVLLEKGEDVAYIKFRLKNPVLSIYNTYKEQFNTFTQPEIIEVEPTNLLEFEINEYLDENKGIFETIINNKYTLLKSPTGSGKTTMLLNNLIKLQDDNIYCFVVPFISILDQLKSKYENESIFYCKGGWLENESVYNTIMGRFNKNKKVIFVTTVDQLQNISNMTPKALQHLFLDETHDVIKSTSYKQSKVDYIFNINAKNYCYLTATPPKDLIEYVNKVDGVVINVSQKSDKVFNLSVINNENHDECIRKLFTLIKDCGNDTIIHVDCDNKKDIALIKDIVVKNNLLKSDEIVKFTSETKKDNMIKTLNNELLNDKIKLVLSTSCFRSGVSINNNKNIIIFAINFNHNPLFSSDIVQIANRFRKANSIIFYLNIFCDENQFYMGNANDDDVYDDEINDLKLKKRRKVLNIFDEIHNKNVKYTFNNSINHRIKDVIKLDNRFLRVNNDIVCYNDIIMDKKGDVFKGLKGVTLQTISNEARKHGVLYQTAKKLQNRIDCIDYNNVYEYVSINNVNTELANDDYFDDLNKVVEGNIEFDNKLELLHFAKFNKLVEQKEYLMTKWEMDEYTAQYYIDKYNHCFHKFVDVLIFFKYKNESRNDTNFNYIKQIYDTLLQFENKTVSRKEIANALKANNCYDIKLMMMYVKLMFDKVVEKKINGVRKLLLGGLNTVFICDKNRGQDTEDIINVSSVSCPLMSTKKVYDKFLTNMFELEIKHPQNLYNTDNLTQNINIKKLYL